MKVMLATLCLNEAEWLPKLWEQHKDWPEDILWVFVESADAAYARANPDMVTSDGLSVDATPDILSDLARRDSRVIHIRHGLSRHNLMDQGKVGARQRYMEEAERFHPQVLVSVDADEFYTREHQRVLATCVVHSHGYGVIFRRREVWRPPSCAPVQPVDVSSGIGSSPFDPDAMNWPGDTADIEIPPRMWRGVPLMSWEVVGGFWDIPCCHWWRWGEGMAFTGNHNTPTIRGRPLPRGSMKRMDLASSVLPPGVGEMPQMVHMGFASARRTRLAKNRYYSERGEGKTDHRAWYVESRAAWEGWHPGDALPYEARVVPYSGPVPECFADQVPATPTYLPQPAAPHPTTVAMQRDRDARKRAPHGPEHRGHPTRTGLPQAASTLPPQGQRTQEET